MAWLLTEKVIPPMLGGDPPDYQIALEPTKSEELPDTWKLRWKERTVGFAASRVEERPTGELDRLSFVEFEDLPVESVLSESLGAVAAVVKPLVQGTRGFDLDMVVATRMTFDINRRLSRFDTTIDLSDVPDFLRIEGIVQEKGKLTIVSQVSSGGAGHGQSFKHSIQLPPEALVESAFSPRPELKGLYIGQKWTIPVVRAFAVNSPIQMLQAEVEQHDIIMWGSDEVETKLVVYRTEAGSGVQATRDPISREWVRDDGTILRQQVSFSGLELTFEREHDSVSDPRMEKLDQLKQRLWSN
ncbi:MAG: hypothetical protein H6822_26075 [Planctomycetaceae bacterium]|nr:hypothetical protein [Planctomycetales bacterium]MCB9925645.1 hypothetical protein [Planctomycetaceae bacterium]